MLTKTYVLSWTEPAVIPIPHEHRSHHWDSFHQMLRKLILQGHQVLVRVE